MSNPRDSLVARLVEDLVGPSKPDEEISARPSDRYLTGILFPQRSPLTGEDDDGALEEEGGGSVGEAGGQADGVAAFDQQRPASAGLSFAVLANQADQVWCDVLVRCARYDLGSIATDTQSIGMVGKTRAPVVWRRVGMEAKLLLGPLSLGGQLSPLAAEGVSGLDLYVNTSKAGPLTLVTISAVNCAVLAEGASREESEAATRFQVGLSVTPARGCALAARPHHTDFADPEEASLALLFRDAPAFVSGHTCSAELVRDENGNPVSVETSWLPEAIVPEVSAQGHSILRAWLSSGNDKVLSAEWLSTAPLEDLTEGLCQFVGEYLRWLGERKAEIPGLEPSFRKPATENLGACGQTAERMTACIESLKNDSMLLDSFRTANIVMRRQRRWQATSRGEPSKELSWRPFQLGFLLCALPSVCIREHPDRCLMDLLWFPTGGGKTEAYLALTAAVLVYRRLRHPDNRSLGAGVGAFMRYTLRLLTMQQFQRAAGMIMALELERRSDPSRFGKDGFAIGLWVGGDAVANDFKSAAKALKESLSNSPAQLLNCPACGSRLSWQALADKKTIQVSCLGGACEFATTGPVLPIYTVDDDVYAKLPSLLIGTVDKFAQIVRNPKAGRLCGVSVPHDRPDLILQDELHLIAGPLGTLVGLYEAAIDELCSQGGRRPKILGSTATIRRAPSQVRALFDRATFQFPPPGTHHEDSFFAVRDFEAPGRKYVGVTTAGRSAKFALQDVMASLLQSGVSKEVISAGVDAYWTLTAYFNALRELGGALVLTEDDVNATLVEFARRRGEPQRKLDSIQELTSRITQAEIREILTNLDVEAPGDAVDVLLASNMISVGVDIPRLALMVVNGQPKTIAEYIQATSRVGRGRVPGVIVTLYNASRARDRSHYESFTSWHAALYRDVEASAVTPYASRARDRALHAVLVAMARHLVPGMATNPRLTAEARSQVEVLAGRFLTRLKGTDDTELAGTRAQIGALLDRWERREGVTEYWNDDKPMTSLLASAEAVAARTAAGAALSAAWGTPNSMRNVEPGTAFRMAEGLRENMGEASGK